MYTRKQYIDNEVSFEDYYGQFVGSSVRTIVSANIGAQRIINSTDESFNDIPLNEWDRLEPGIRSLWAVAFKKATGIEMSRSDCVCIAKVAAKQIRDALNG